MEDAINSFPTTATSIAIRSEKASGISVYAPYGLNDVFGMVVRANKTQIRQPIYEAKVKRWVPCWPNLKVIPWEH